MRFNKGRTNRTLNYLIYWNAWQSTLLSSLARWAVRNTEISAAHTRRIYSALFTVCDITI